VPDGATGAVKRSLAHAGSAEAAIDYYRQIPLKLPPSLRRRIPVPTVAFAGEEDGVLTDLSVYEQSRTRFTAEYEVVRMPGGHFLHLEHPARFTDELLRVLRRHAPT
jgi:pimeloyl-ACP methyl ester carboxylesterase